MVHPEQPDDIKESCDGALGGAPSAALLPPEHQLSGAVSSQADERNRYREMLPMTATIASKRM
jgi:hypothetical protein